MRPVDPSVYRAALDRCEVGKRALREIAKGQWPIARLMSLAAAAVEQIENAAKWDNAPDTHSRAVAEALSELVLLKDLKEAADRLNATGHYSAAPMLAEMRAEYRRRKPLAWERARIALGGAAKPPEAVKELIAAASDDLLRDVDGFFYYFPKAGGGSLAPWMLRAIADELDRRNDPWEKELDAYFKEHT